MALPNVLDDAFLDVERYAYYAECRNNEPIQFISDSGDYRTWAVFKYEDVKKLSMAPGARLNPVGQNSPAWMTDSIVLQRFLANLSQIDGPIHGALRRSVSSFFSPRNVESIREVSSFAVARLITRISEKTGTYDAVEEFAGQVPRDVICSILGLPVEDWNMLIAMQHDFLMIFSFTPLSDTEQNRLHDVTKFYLDYFRQSLESGKIDRSTSLVAHLLAEESFGNLNHVQVLSIMHTVLDGGYETTRTSIANAIEIFANNPHILLELKECPANVNNAVEEFLRFRAPVHIRQRYLVEDYTTTDGQLIKAGDRVFLSLASACRDEGRFANPDEIRVSRSNATEHVAFGGGGVHSCLGTALARLQLQEVFKGVVNSIEKFEMSGPPAKRHRSLIFPALEHLHVRSTPFRISIQGNASVEAQ